MTLNFSSKVDWDASMDEMAQELKDYANEKVLVWADDIGDILDRGFRTGTYFKDALGLYAQAKWILVDSKEDSE